MKVQNGTAAILNRSCYGYRHNDNGDLQVDETEAGVVRAIFDMYLQRGSILTIIRELEVQGIKSPAGKDKWCKRSIETMLRNEKYNGDVVVFKTLNVGYPEMKRQKNTGEHSKYISVGNHPAIISKEAFEAVQAERARRSNFEQDENGTRRKSTRYTISTVSPHL